MIWKPSEILEAVGTDKHPHHNYGAMYDKLLQGRLFFRNILEIGVLHGRSHLAWSFLFPQAAIVGADIDPETELALRLVPRSEFLLLDVGNWQDLCGFAESLDSCFHLIVEDSSHVGEHQRNIRLALFHALAVGGVLVIEDVSDDNIAEELATLGGRVWDYRGLTGDPNSRAFSFERA